VSVSEFWNIGFRESQEQVVGYRDRRNRDKEKSERGRGRVSVDCFSGFGDLKDKRVTNGFVKVRSPISRSKRGNS
jgi:hypothetical protein